MSTEIDIDPPFEDENDFRKRLQEQKDNPGSTSPAPVASGEPEIENDLPGSPNAIPFQNAKPGDKSNEQEAKDIEQKERKRYRQEQQERLADFYRQQAEQRRQQQQQKREEVAASREMVRDVRSQAISQRVESYSLAAAVGLPGYITASVLSSLGLIYNEDKKVKQEQDYQAELARYHEVLRKDAEAKAAAEKAAIQNAPMRATVFDSQGKPIPHPPATGSNTTTPTATPTQSPANIPIPPSNIPPAQGPPLTPPPVPPTPSGGGTVPPNQSPPPSSLVPPPIPPTPPGRAPISPSSAVSPAIVITAAVEAARMINKGVDNAGQAASQVGQSVVTGDYSGGAKSAVKAGQSVVDPLGLNVPLNVAVQGFNTLVDINQSILDVTRENLAFAPLSLDAEVTADISRLVQQISISQRTDATTAELIRANRQFEEAWAELKVSLIKDLGPTIVLLLKAAAAALPAIETAIVALGVAIAPKTAAFLFLLKKIADNTAKDEVDELNNTVFDQLERFFNPATPVNVK